MLRTLRTSNKYQFYNLWFEPTIYRTRGEHASHYSTDVIQMVL